VRDVALADGTYTVLVADRAEASSDALLVGDTPAGRALAFRSAAAALRAAAALQAAASAQVPSAAPSRPAVGVHAGEVSAAGGVEARPVALAARLATLAEPGQILVSSLARELAGDDPELRFGEGREATLPGLAGRMTVHELLWSTPRRGPLRVVIADDAALVRDGVAALLRDHGVEVVATAADAEELQSAVARGRPDVALVDIRMPPTFKDEGLVAAERIRAAFPEVGVLVLSQHLDARYALRVTEASPARTGYLLKDRVTDSQILFDALERIAAGGCVIDRAVAEGLVTRASALARIDELTEREREVLALIAEGLSNRAIAERLVVTQKTVETHIRQVFLKLGLRESEGEDRRVAAVLAYLRAGTPA
jgi:DNA-binding NarL/FixJ family response regulator